MGQNYSRGKKKNSTTDQRSCSTTKICQLLRCFFSLGTICHHRSLNYVLEMTLLELPHALSHQVLPVTYAVNFEKVFRGLVTNGIISLIRHSRNSAFPLMWCIKWQLSGADWACTSEPPGAVWIDFPYMVCFFSVNLITSVKEVMW